MEYGANELCCDMNCISAYLAVDDFNGQGPDAATLDDLRAIVLLGNQVIATLAAACTLMRRSPAAALLLSGGVGHSTPLLFDNLRHSAYGVLVQQGLLKKTMAEAEMYAAVARHAFHIADSRLLIENRSRNSGENARFSLQMLKDQDNGPGPIVILQDPTMQRRSMLTWTREAEIAGANARTLSHAAFVPRVEPGPDGTVRLVGASGRGTWTLERFAGLILGEIERLHDDENGYGPKGRNFLPHVDISEPVWESYRRISTSLPAEGAVR